MRLVYERFLDKSLRFRDIIFLGDGTFHPKRNSPMFTRVPIFALLSFCAALLTLYDRFLSWAVITVIGRVPLCMSSTGTVKRQGLLNVLRQAKHTSPISLGSQIGQNNGSHMKPSQMSLDSGGQDPLE